MKTWSNACPKCLGDLREEVSVYDTYVFCTKCRYTLTHREKAALLPQQATTAPAPKEQLKQA